MKNITEEDKKRIVANYKEVLKRVEEDLKWYDNILQRWENESKHENWNEYEKNIKRTFHYLKDLIVYKKKLEFRLDDPRAIGSIVVGKNSFNTKLEVIDIVVTQIPEKAPKKESKAETKPATFKGRIAIDEINDAIKTILTKSKDSEMIKKAKELGVQLISEADFFKMIA